MALSAHQLTEQSAKPMDVKFPLWTNKPSEIICSNILVLTDNAHGPQLN